MASAADRVESEAEIGRGNLAIIQAIAILIAGIIIGYIWSNRISKARRAKEREQWRKWQADEPLTFRPVEVDGIWSHAKRSGTSKGDDDDRTAPLHQRGMR